ncbi:hypothetical protein T08_16529 [Trichinella sp. T8]|nr:hypothetical protein T08_16529 [Trichinella sp. T8]
MRFQVRSMFYLDLSAISEASIKKTSAKKKSFAAPVFSLSHVVDQRNVLVNKNCFHITTLCTNKHNINDSDLTKFRFIQNKQ